MLRARHGKSSTSGFLAAIPLAAVALLYAPNGSTQQPASAVSATAQSAILQLQLSPGFNGGALVHDGLLLRARALQELDEHEAALPLLREALQLARVASGLYHEGQLGILHSLIESESVRENWRQVDDYFALLRSQYERLYADDAVRLEQGLAMVTDWHVDALRHGLDGRAVPHLRQARELFKLRLQLAEGAPDPDAGKVERLRRNIDIAESHLTLYSLRDNKALREHQAQHREMLLSSLW